MIKKDSQLKEVLGHGKKCTDKCGHCCKHGTGFLAYDDKQTIAKYLNISEEKLEEYLEPVEKFNTTLQRPKIHKKEGMPYGRCVFLDDSYGCTIHPVKPLHCQVGTCGEHGEDLALWFTLNFFVNPNDSESIRQFATYLKTGGKTLEGGELKDFVPDEAKLKKILDYEE